MSLINEALKKAQRVRHEGVPPGAGASSDAGGPIAKRAQPRSARSMLLLGAGAVVLVVLSMVLTAVWLTRPVSTPAASAKPTPVVAAKPAGEAPTITLPSLTAPPPTASAPTPPAPVAAAPKPAPTVVATKGALAAPVTPPSAPVERPVVTPTPPPVTPAEPAVAATPPPPAPPAKPDEKIQQYVDGLRVMGIRSSGNESKVLMNDRVYRVNDFVDRALGVRLTKVAPDNLTFTDANGATYVKFF